MEWACQEYKGISLAKLINASFCKNSHMPSSVDSEHSCIANMIARSSHGIYADMSSSYPCLLFLLMI
jgi:hypothetical protein